jgi:hypothetical protein
MTSIFLCKSDSASTYLAIVIWRVHLAKMKLYDVPWHNKFEWHVWMLDSFIVRPAWCLSVSHFVMLTPVKNHGIAQHCLDEVLKVNQEYYSLPAEEKMKVCLSECCT